MLVLSLANRVLLSAVRQTAVSQSVLHPSAADVGVQVLVSTYIMATEKIYYLLGTLFLFLASF
jgi:hypothetical protein